VVTCSGVRGSARARTPSPMCQSCQIRSHGAQRAPRRPGRHLTLYSSCIYNRKHADIKFCHPEPGYGLIDILDTCRRPILSAPSRASSRGLPTIAADRKRGQGRHWMTGGRTRSFSAAPADEDAARAHRTTRTAASEATTIFCIRELLPTGLRRRWFQPGRPGRAFGLPGPS